MQAEPVAHPGEELRAVARGAAGFGRDRRARVTPRGPHLVAADAQRLQRALDRGFGERAALRQPLAEPDDAGERVDDAKPRIGRPRDQQAAIVRAQVQGGVNPGRRRTRPRLRRLGDALAQRGRCGQFKTPGGRLPACFPADRNTLSAGCNRLSAAAAPARKAPRSSGAEIGVDDVPTVHRRRRRARRQALGDVARAEIDDAGEAEAAQQRVQVVGGEMAAEPLAERGDALGHALVEQAVAGGI